MDSIFEIGEAKKESLLPKIYPSLEEAMKSTLGLKLEESKILDQKETIYPEVSELRTDAQVRDFGEVSKHNGGKVIGIFSTLSNGVQIVEAVSKPNWLSRGGVLVEGFYAVSPEGKAVDIKSVFPESVALVMDKVRGRGGAFYAMGIVRYSVLTDSGNDGLQNIHWSSIFHERKHIGQGEGLQNIVYNLLAESPALSRIIPILIHNWSKEGARKNERQANAYALQVIRYLRSNGVNLFPKNSNLDLLLFYGQSLYGHDKQLSHVKGQKFLKWKKSQKN